MFWKIAEQRRSIHPRAGQLLVQGHPKVLARLRGNNSSVVNRDEEVWEGLVFPREKEELGFIQIGFEGMRRHSNTSVFEASRCVP